MATWRHREMESALGGAVDRSMTPESLRRVVVEFSGEAEFVDLKRKGALLGSHSVRDEWRFECGKDVASFANARGGVLIWGVRDAKSVESEDKQLEPFEAEEAIPGDLEDKFRRAVREVTAPPPAFDIFPVYEGASYYMVCVVPPSAAAPHAVTMPGDGRSGLVYPRRAAGESHAVYLREFQVAELYERRARSSDDRRRRAETVWTDGVDVLEAPGAPRVWIAVASVPDLARDDVLTADTRREIDEWEDSVDPFPTLIQKGFVGIGGYPVSAPGRICTTEAVRTPDAAHALTSAVRNFYSEIHVDGSAFAALPLSAPDAESPFTIMTDDLVDKVVTATAHVVAWTTARIGLWGGSTVTAGVVVSGSDDAVLQVDGYGGHPSLRIIGRRVDRRWPRAVTTVELADTWTMQERLVVAFHLATPLVQAFGVPGLGWLTASGELLPHEMPRDQIHLVRDWASRHRVPLH
ncbi:ATP-binding protein [Mycobacteroides chelonae]|nr:ATP-binding protein [Mycobacteroides chelonae]